MARNMTSESEYGLGLMPVLTPEGTVVDAGSASGVDALARGGLPAGNGDVDSLKNGGDQDLSTQLRAIYARDPDAPLGDASTAIGTS